jgi:hypothetical protein
MIDSTILNNKVLYWIFSLVAFHIYPTLIVYVGYISLYYVITNTDGHNCLFWGCYNNIFSWSDNLMDCRLLIISIKNQIKNWKLWGWIVELLQTSKLFRRMSIMVGNVCFSTFICIFLLQIRYWGIRNINYVCNIFHS